MFSNLTRSQLVNIIIGVVGILGTTIVICTVISTRNTSPSSGKSDKLEVLPSAGTGWKLFEVGSVLPGNAFVGGSNSDGRSIYVCRVNSTISVELLPGMYDPAQGACQITYGGKVYSYAKFDLLITNDPSSLVWLSNKNGEASLGSIVGGLSDRNDELHIARARVSEQGQTIGKVHGRHAKAYVPFEGKETEMISYEVLCSFDYTL